MTEAESVAKGSKPLTGQLAAAVEEVVLAVQRTNSGATRYELLDDRSVLEISVPEPGSKLRLIPRRSLVSNEPGHLAGGPAPTLSEEQQRRLLEAKARKSFGPMPSETA
ncbi:MAG: hypothetical protein H0U03_02745 [Actinobacteria bacterium]|nr:hypothetical protein [Actinomycetota bacterium]